MAKEEVRPGIIQLGKNEENEWCFSFINNSKSCLATYPTKKAALAAAKTKFPNNVIIIENAMGKVQEVKGLHAARKAVKMRLKSKLDTESVNLAIANVLVG